MGVEEESRENRHRVVLIFLKFIPIITAACYMVSTICNYLGYNIEALSNIGGMSLLTWLFVYLTSVLFKFCIYHRMFMWYILLDDSINIIDYYWKIPISTDNILMLYNIFIGILLFLILFIYVRNHKIPITKNNK